MKKKNGGCYYYYCCWCCFNSFICSFVCLLIITWNIIISIDHCKTFSNCDSAFNPNIGQQLQLKLLLPQTTDIFWKVFTFRFPKYLVLQQILEWETTASLTCLSFFIFIFFFFTFFEILMSYFSEFVWYLCTAVNTRWSSEWRRTVGHRRSSFRMFHIHVLLGHHFRLQSALQNPTGDVTESSVTESEPRRGPREHNVWDEVPERSRLF